jgi:hypothetical protein
MYLYIVMNIVEINQGKLMEGLMRALGGPSGSDSLILPANVLVV